MKAANLSENEKMRLEDQIMERALTLWRKKGKHHRNAWNAWQQAERELLKRNKN